MMKITAAVFPLALALALAGCAAADFLIGLSGLVMLIASFVDPDPLQTNSI
jgi:hypothetical protein